MRNPKTPLTLTRDGLLRILRWTAWQMDRAGATPEGRPASITYIHAREEKAA